MDKRELEQRTKTFAVHTIRFISGLPKGATSNVISYQLIKCSSSIGANYREANRAESRADFIHKIAIAEKESSETCYWLEVLQELGFEPANKMATLLEEAQELLKIFSSIGRSTKGVKR